MSESLDTLRDIVDDRASATTDPVINLRTGVTFAAEIEPLSDLSLLTELGIDPRASHYFHVRDNAVDLQAGDRLTALNATFKILPGPAPENAANPMRKFLAMQLTGKDG